jgi:predicted secreted protein
MAEDRIRIESYDMNEGTPLLSKLLIDMKMRAVDFILNSQAEKAEDLAKKLKLDFDQQFNCSWQCVVGKEWL